MPEEAKPPRRKHGPNPSRLAYTEIGFHVTPALHEAMKALADEREVNFDEVYHEAAKCFLECREKEELVYIAAPHTRRAARVYMRMDTQLCAKLRLATKTDDQGLSNAFETAVRLYLKASPFRST